MTKTAEEQLAGARVRCAELEAELAHAEDRLSVRKSFAKQKPGRFDGEAFGDEIATLVKSYVDRKQSAFAAKQREAEEAMLASVAGLETELSELRDRVNALEAENSDLRDRFAIGPRDVAA